MRFAVIYLLLVRQCHSLEMNGGGSGAAELLVLLVCPPPLLLLPLLLSIDVNIESNSRNALRSSGTPLTPNAGRAFRSAEISRRRHNAAGTTPQAQRRERAGEPHHTQYN